MEEQAEYASFLSEAIRRRAAKEARIKRDYEALVAVCQELDHQYSEGGNPEAGFRVGHYDVDILPRLKRGGFPKS